MQSQQKEEKRNRIYSLKADDGTECIGEKEIAQEKKGDS